MGSDLLTQDPKTGTCPSEGLEQRASFAFVGLHERFGQMVGTFSGAQKRPVKRVL